MPESDKYFSLAIKTLTVKGETVSNTTRKKLKRISELDENSDTYTLSAYLIAQLGKNFAENNSDLISFYLKNRFVKFDARQKKGTEEPHELIQFLRLL